MPLLRTLIGKTVVLFGVNATQAYINSLLPYSPVAFYDAAGSKVWQDSSRTTPATTDTDVAGAWDDLSGNGYHVTQAVTANKPAYRTNVTNGLPVIRGDGTDDFLRNASFPDFGDAYTVIVVMAYASGGDTTQAAMEVSTGTANTGFSLFHQATGKWRTVDSVASGDVDTLVDYRDSTFRIHSGRVTGTLRKYQINGSSPVSDVAYTSPNPNTLTTLDLFRLAGSATYSMNGDIATLLIFNTSLSDADLLAVETILNNRYGSLY